jgi:hypothetical protein
MPGEAPEHQEDIVAPSPDIESDPLRDLEEVQKGPIEVTDTYIDNLPEVDVQIGTEAVADEAVTIEKPGAKTDLPNNVIDIEEARKRLRNISEN